MATKKKTKKRKSFAGARTSKVKDEKPRITAWSFSRFDDYDSCPYKAKCKHILRIKEKDPGPALARGGDIHDKAEGYLKGEIKKLPVELARFADLFKELRSPKMRKLLQIEKELGLDKNWNECSWFGSATWLRIKMDLMFDDPSDMELRHVMDWKTGRENPEKHKLQLSLYGIGAFITAPQNIKVVQAEMVYLDNGATLTEEYYVEDLEKAKKEWLRRSKKMLSDTTFKPTPSGWACQYCYLSKAKQGVCKF